ncbi:MAG: hydroxymethylglutaryl-CoA synthase [Nitrososphaerales archaeon]
MSEPIARRKIIMDYRIKASKCEMCGKVYFPPKSFCNLEGRVSKVVESDYFYSKGIFYSGCVIRKPTNKFNYLKSFISCIVSFDNGAVKVPGRITDYRLNNDDEIDITQYIGKGVIPRFRRIYDDGNFGLIYYSSFNFSFEDDYYPYQEYKVVKPSGKSDKPGIIGYGIYIPKFRIKGDENSRELGILERALPFADEDATTFAVEAGKRALIHSAINSQYIKKCYVGSESAPYVVKPSMATISQVLELGEKFDDGFFSGGVDAQFACKAATDLIIDAAALVNYPTFNGEYVMIIGSDNAQAAPNDPLDFSVGAGAAAFIIGKRDVIATIDYYISYTSDTPDFYRRDGCEYPKHGGRFTGEPAYFKHVCTVMKRALKDTNLSPRDINYVVLHSPNAKFPMAAALQVGFEKDQIEPGLIVKKVGNLYSGSSLAALGAVLDISKPGDKILMVSYGSGAGSDAYLFTVTKNIESKRERLIKVQDQIENPHREYVDYYTYREWKTKNHPL